MVSPAQRREVLAHVQTKGLSGRAACRWTGLSRTVWRYAAKRRWINYGWSRCVMPASASRASATPAPTAGAGRRVGVLVGLSFKIAWRL